MSARVLTLDIENSPITADVWSLWNVNVGINQIHDIGHVMCWSAKWYDEKRIQFMSDHHDGHEAMVQGIWQLVNDADVVVHYNGSGHDMPWLRREFLLAALQPPAPVLEIDLLKTMRSQFKFPSNKLAAVTEQLGLAGKMQNEGHGLWTKCLEGDERAWRVMRRYNMNDVRITEQLYDAVRGWIPGHPNMNLFNGEPCCPRCGSTELRREGVRRTQLATFQRWQCRSCGGWSSSGKAEERVDMRGVR